MPQMAVYRMLAAAAAGACGTAGRRGRAAAAATAPIDRLFGFDDETVVGHVNLDIASLGLKFLVDKEGKSTGLEYFVFIVRLIQSQSQAWAGSAASCEIDADRGCLLVLEVAFELLLGSFSNFEHVNSS